MELTVDQPLASLAKAYDGQAFELLVARYEMQVLRVCQRMLGQTGEAEEAAQDVFMKLHRSLHSIDEQRELGAWLYRVAVNTCLDRKRRPQPVEISPEHPDSARNPAELAQTREQWRLVEAALLRLPDKERAAIVLRDVEGLTTREVAAVLENSEVTVRTQIASARIKLRKMLERVL